METNNTPTLIQDRKTGAYYDPVAELDLIFSAEWFKKIMIRLKNR